MLLEGSAVNIDWDRSLKDLRLRPDVSAEPLSRSKRLHFSPGAPERLLSAFVWHQVELDFTAMQVAVEGIERLTRADIEQELAPFVEVAFAGGRRFGLFTEPSQLVDAVVARKDGLRERLGQLVDDVQAEREQLLLQARTLAGFGFPELSVGDTTMQVASLLAETKVLSIGNDIAQVLRRVMRLMHVG